MHNTCITTTISLRTRGLLSVSFNDYSHCSNERHPFTYSSSRTCCSCCSNPMYKVPISPGYCYSLYGLRQSSLIQWSPYRKVILGGFDRCYYGRLPVCDVERSCYCDKVCNRTVGGRKTGLRKCMVFEERSERYDIEGVDEAEALLSLLTADIDEECFHVTKEISRLVKKPVVLKGENVEVNNRCGSKKKKVDPKRNYGSLDSWRKKDNRWREAIIRSEEENEALLRKENQEVMVQEERNDALLINRTAREKDERESWLRRRSQKNDAKESTLRKDNLTVSSRTEDQEDLLTREEHRQKVRRDGSSCSSYYSVSSTADYESDNEVELREGRFEGESLSGHKRNLRISKLDNHDAMEEDQRRSDYIENRGDSLTMKGMGKETSTGSSVVESDFRKKSEKKLVDISVEEKASKESKFSMARESNYEKSSDYYVGYDDRKQKPAGSMKFDEERKQRLRQTGNEVSRQSETRMKYKQFAETQHSLNDDIRNSYGSQRVYGSNGEMSAKVTSSSQEAVGEHLAASGLSTVEDEYQRNSRKVAEVSEIQELDITKTSISRQRVETSFKEEDYSTNSHRSSVNDVEKQQQQQQRDQASGIVDSTEKSQQLTKKDGKSILKTESNKLKKQKENLNLGYSSSLESREPHSHIHAKIIERDSSRNESNELTKIDVENKNKTKSETLGRSPSHLLETGVLPLGSTAGISTDEVVDGSSQFGSTATLGRDIEKTPMFHYEAHDGAERNSSHGHSHEDAIESAAQLEKSSAHYVGEFVDQVRSEMLSSEIQREKKTNETKFVHEEQDDQKNLVKHSPGDSLSKEHESRHDDDRSRAKGPSDEMWNVDEPSVQELSKTEVQENASKASTAITKRSGRSLWNIITDIVHLRWSPHSESHSSGRKTGERSSPNQSTSSETWFSGYDAEENEAAIEEKKGKSITQGSSASHQEEVTRSRVDEGSSSSTSVGHLRPVGINTPSSSVVPERHSPTSSISLPSGGKNSEGTSSAAIVDSSVPSPALRLRRSPAVRGVLQTGEASASDSGMTEQLNTGLVKQPESAVNEGELKRRKLERKDQFVKDRFDELEEAYRLEAEQRRVDEMFMREALLEAQKAADNWEVPVGAVLVHNGKMIARGCNLVEELRDSTAHAEMICIREASNMLRTWRLSETTLYVTLEPCPMCAGAILQARIDTVVWGAPNKLLGADGSWISLFPSGDGGNGLDQTDKPPAPVHPFHPKIIIRRGVLASECADAMQQFFKLRRKKDKKPKPSPSPPSCLPVSHHPSKFLAKMHDAFHLMFCL
ncbi:Cytosine deaminase FCY1 [Handroanthus impetiginosus]|uniref:tRNA(adenine(34)) deaminase n=1 Tax=Handroanthus impetiginosus TaxID=429701 RepID=A0A2G9H7Z8_9LAMI|nr:Cytosine deaminase FCY1 [Handroanthus impetiginosus]